MSLLNRIETDASGLFSDAEKALAAFAGALLDSIEANGGKVLIDAATSAVSAAEAQGGDSAEKLAAAQSAIVNTLASQGEPVVMNAVNGAIEAAVAALPQASAAGGSAAGGSAA